MSLSFEWDAEKAKANVRKHRVSFEDAVTVFADTVSITVEEPAPASDEARFITMGRSVEGKFLTTLALTSGSAMFIVCTVERVGCRKKNTLKKRTRDGYHEVHREGQA